MMSPKPRQCPHCGSETVLDIIYVPGQPDASASGLPYVRRTNPTGNDPRWYCGRCRLEWGHPRGLSGTLSDDKDLA